jgi:hypothetical protein
MSSPWVRGVPPRQYCHTHFAHALTVASAEEKEKQCPECRRTLQPSHGLVFWEVDTDDDDEDDEEEGVVTFHPDK